METTIEYLFTEEQEFELIMEAKRLLNSIERKGKEPDEIEMQIRKKANDILDMIFHDNK